MRDGRDQAVLHDAERHLGFDFFDREARIVLSCLFLLFVPLD